MALRFKIVMGTVALALAVAVGTLVLLRSRMLPRFPYMARPLSDVDYAAMAAQPGWHSKRLTVAPGIELRGLVREPTAPDKPWVMFFNGNSPQMLREGQRVLDGLCAQQGWGGMVWAYRGFDSSGGTPDPAALEDDGFKAYNALLAERKVNPAAIHLVGFSLGTGIAAAVAARARSEPPASLTLLAPMTWLYLGERTQLRLHRYETSKWLQQITSPVLVIHGQSDATLGVENGRAVAQLLGKRARLLEVPGLGHYELAMSAAAQEATREFVSQNDHSRK
jgi:pimeloyl-ACP methyl ester carboxylesterase